MTDLLRDCAHVMLLQLGVILAMVVNIPDRPGLMGGLSGGKLTYLLQNAFA